MAGSEDGRHPVSDGVGNVAPGAPVVWGSVLVCVSEPGTATITSVEPVDPVGGLTVDDFAVRPNPWKAGVDAVGAAHSDLEHLGFGTAKTVDVPCGSPEIGMELAIQASRPREENAASYGWKVTYSAQGDTGTFEIPVSVQLCGDGPAWKPDCAALSPEWVRD